MPHTIEAATSGRSKCRGCGKAISKGDLRFGERVENPYGEGERSLWFHVDCGALKRSEPFLEAIAEADLAVPDTARLSEEAKLGVSHRRLCRIDGAERSPTGRARCRSCRELIEKNAWRIPLVYWDEARFTPSGFMHASCSRDYLETTEVMARVSHFSPSLSAEELTEIRGEVERVQET